MTKIKLCGLTRTCDIDAANELKPDYIGFVFAEKSRRHITPEKAFELRSRLSPGIRAVGVFVDEKPEAAADLLNSGVIDIAQLHGSEGEDYISFLKSLAQKPVIKAFRVKTEGDIKAANESATDYILLDSGSGSGTVFDWSLIKNIKKPFFLAGGLSPENVSKAVEMFRPFAVDVSSGIETGGVKDRVKMAAFIAAVQEVNNL